MGFRADEPALHAAAPQFGFDGLEQNHAAAPAALRGMDIEDIEVAGQTSLVMQPRRHKSDEIPDELALFPQCDKQYFAARISLQIDVVLGIQRHLLFVQRELFIVQRKQRLELFKPLREGFDVRGEPDYLDSRISTTMDTRSSAELLTTECSSALLNQKHSPVFMLICSSPHLSSAPGSPWSTTWNRV